MEKTETEVDKDKGYWFAVGSLRFRSFRELHDNIKGRTGAFSKPCSIVKNGEGVFNFPLKYECSRLKGRERFVLEWEPVVMAAFRSDSEMSRDLSKHLPKFQRVGCTANGGFTKARWYGFLDVKKMK